MDKPIFDKAFSSPFRADNNPSFIVKRARAYFKDYATGEFGDCFTFVKKLYKVNYNDALRQIVMDMGLKPYFNVPDMKYLLKKKAKVANALKGKSYVGGFKLAVKSRKWTAADVAYWESYGISLEAVKWGNIVPISHYFINGRPFVADIYAYAYIERKDGVVTYKVYQPFSKHMKWINNNNYSIWELWKSVDALPSEDLVITSSRKDALNIMCSLGIAATAFQAETIMPKPQVLNYVFSKMNRVFLLFDNDFDKSRNWGQEAAQKINR